MPGYLQFRMTETIYHVITATFHSGCQKIPTTRLTVSFSSTQVSSTSERLLHYFSFLKKEKRKKNSLVSVHDFGRCPLTRNGGGDGRMTAEHELPSEAHVLTIV